MLSNTVLSVLFILFTNALVNGDRVKIKQGILQGTIFKSRNGKPFHAFLGIPYAKPPVGDLRFKDPEEHPGWFDERDATKDGSVCPQDMPYFPGMEDQIFGDEDCLFLNVYTPTLDREANLSVMIWIHGGGFLMGDGTSKMYGPNYILDRDVILVTIQYRLGVLGFLAFDNEIIPGNFGLKDQSLALQWVQKNIQDFGGNPSSVTLFGESAGSASVGFHLVSPMSKGLFQKAILESGTPYCTWAITPEDIAHNRANAFATLTGCPTKPIEKTLKCLQKLPTREFIATAAKFFKYLKSPMMRFSAVVESSPKIKNKFLPDHPSKLSHHDVPIIVGMNNDEGGISGAPLCQNDFKLVKQCVKDNMTEYVFTMNFIIDWVEPEKIPSYAEKINQFYFKGRNTIIDKDNVRNLVDLVTDAGFLRCLYETSIHHLSQGSVVYVYLYNYTIPISFNSLFGECPFLKGTVSHADELFHLFKIGGFDYELTEEQVKQSNIMIDLWTNFAKHGIPTSKGVPDWLPVKSKSIEHLYIDNKDIRMKESLFPDRLNFIKSLEFITSKQRYKKSNMKSEL